MILTVGNTKGGVGKTTIALQLALARSLEGKDVLLVDGDRQGTSQIAIQMRSDENITPNVTCIFLPDGPILRTQVINLKDKFDDVIIDAGGRDSTALRAALTLSDTLLIPYRPRSFDVWAIDNISALINEVNSVRDGLQAFAILNAADTHHGSKDNADAAAALVDYPHIKSLPTVLHNRKSFADSVGRGLSIFEHSPADEKAKSELKSLISVLF